MISKSCGWTASMRRRPRHSVSADRNVSTRRVKTTKTIANIHATVLSWLNRPPKTVRQNQSTADTGKTRMSSSTPMSRSYRRAVIWWFHVPWAIVG
jgi:hypothetical protein